MAKAKVAIPKKLPTVDLLVEVRDARLPVTSAQFEMDSMMRLGAGKHRIVVLNKQDLVPRTECRKSVSLLELQGTPVLPTSAINHSNVSEVLAFIAENVHAKFKSLGVTVMVTGLPNTGKSTLLNAMRALAPNPAVNKAPAKTSGIPGSTQHVGRIQISLHHPKIYVLDTPGIMLTKSSVFEEDNAADIMMKLAAVGAMPETVPGISSLADYMLFTLNRLREFRYVDMLGLPAPSNDIDEVVLAVSRRINGGSSRIDHHAGTMNFIHMFQEGRLGKICLDALPDVDSVMVQIAREKEFVFETEPPGPWGPQRYPIDNTMSRAIYKPRA
jgi:ribosome biogenesis GTPase A